MKLLLAVHHYPPRYTAGAELYTHRLARWLIAHGHEVEVVCVEELNGDRPAALTARLDHHEGVPVWRLSLGMAGAPFSWSYDHPLINAWLAEHLAQRRPHLLHLHSGYLLGAGVLETAALANLPAVVTLHDYWFLCPRITLLRGDGSLCQAVPADPAVCAWCLQMGRRPYRYAEQLSGGAAGAAWRHFSGAGDGATIAARRSFLHRALTSASVAVAPSRFLAQQFAGALSPERLQVIRLGMDPGPPAPRLTAPRASTLRLGYVGQIAAHKGVHVLARAIGLIADNGRPVTLTIYGDPGQHHQYGDRLRRQVAGDARITLAGRFENSRIAEVLAGLDALVVPSIWYENSPLTILEAQAAGVPVITSALGGMAELVQDGVDGLHFRPGDAADLARQIRRLRDNPELLAQLRAGVRPPPTIDDEFSALAAVYARVARQVPGIVQEVA